MSKNVNNDVSKDPPIDTVIAVFLRVIAETLVSAPFVG